MANEKFGAQKEVLKKKDQADRPAKIVTPVERKVKFLVWFSGAIGRFDGLKPHHFSPIQTYFQGLGLSEPQPESAYDAALIKYGYSKIK